MQFRHFGRQLLLGATMALAAGLSAAFAADNLSPAPLATFANGETITQDDLTQYVARRVDLRQPSRNMFGVITIVKEMALARALVLDGPLLKVERRDERELQRFDDIYALAVYKRIAPACAAPRDEVAVRKFFDDTPQAFNVPVTVRLARIMLPRTGEIDSMPTVGWMLQQITAMGEGKQTFEQAAAQATKVYSADPQGDVGWVTLPSDSDSNIMRAISSVSPGEMVGPVPEGEFVYLFHVLARHPSRTLTWDEAKGGAAARVVSYCHEQAQASVQSKMFEKYGIKINRPAIEKMFDRVTTELKKEKSVAPAKK